MIGSSVGFSFVVTSVSLVVPEDSVGAVVDSSSPDEIIEEVQHSCNIVLFYFFSKKNYNKITFSLFALIAKITINDSDGYKC